MDKEMKDYFMEIAREKGIEAQKEMAEMLKIPFTWPTIEEQVYNKGYIGDYKRGRAKNPRMMFYIPKARLENGFTMPGFVCHPDMAIAAAKELLRLKGREDLVKLLEDEK